MSCDRKPQSRTSFEPQASADDDEVRALPSAEAMLAGTLALMTGVVERAALTQPLAGHAQSLMMAAKVRSNLFFLSGHPQLSTGFRTTVERLRTHWDRLAVPAGAAAEATVPDPAQAARQLWHRTPERLQ
jgi:hypothetical protein